MNQNSVRQVVYEKLRNPTYCSVQIVLATPRSTSNAGTPRYGWTISLKISNTCIRAAQWWRARARRPPSQLRQHLEHGVYLQPVVHPFRITPPTWCWSWWNDHELCQPSCLGRVVIAKWSLSELCPLTVHFSIYLSSFVFSSEHISCVWVHVHLCTVLTR